LCRSNFIRGTSVVLYIWSEPRGKNWFIAPPALEISL
jgi:hypothetical protein